MHLKQKISYKLSRLATMAMIGGTTMMGGCGNDNGPDTVDAKDIEIEFSLLRNGFDAITPDTLRIIAARPDVANIYLVPVDIWYVLSPIGIHNLRQNVLEPAIAVDPKRITGRGNFPFTPGAANSTDSLWYIQNNWKIIPRQR